jgi:hypothetical protein
MYKKFQASLTSSDLEDRQQQTLDNMFNSKIQKYGPRHEEQLKITKSLADNVIIGCGLPVSLVESKSFAKFMSDVNPKYQLPSRYHVTSKLIPQTREKRVTDLNSQLDEAKYVALTVDIWTDRCMHSYIGITVHTFINCQAKFSPLHLAAFKGSHTGAKIAAELEKVIAEHKIQGKLAHIVCDNASNMRKAFQLLQQKAWEDGNYDEAIELEETG